MKPYAIILVLILMAFSIGCMSLEQNVEPTITTMPIPTTIVTFPPIPTQTTIPTTIETTVTLTAIPTPSPTTKINYESPHSDVVLENWGYKLVKYQDEDLIENFFTISDCWMKQIYPEIVNNQNYGTKGNPPTLTGISAFEFRKLEREMMEGKGQVSSTIGFSCEDIPGTDKWVFVETKGVILSNNAKPSLYEFDIVVKRYGKFMTEIKSNQTLIQDQRILFYSYIPIRQKEMEQISGFELYVIRLTNN